MKVRFTKMHGAGNDYIYVNTMNYPVDEPGKWAVEWSRFHTGIGSDGLVLIGSSEKGDFSMRIFNADGSEAKMCGNASRCIGKYVYEAGLTAKRDIALDTLSGIRRLHLDVDADNRVNRVTVDMGVPSDIHPLTLGCEAPAHTGIAVSMGNPHLVLFVDRVMEIDLAAVGPRLEHHPHFPDRVNVEFAQVIDARHIRMRVWERGSGVTQACGTGACATAAAAIAGWIPADIRIGIKITPTAALQPAALGIAILMIKVAIVAPGMSIKPIFFSTLPIATTKCLSQPVYFITIAKPMQEHTEVISPAFVILLANASNAAIGLPAITAIKIPAAISTILDSCLFNSR